MCRWCSCGSSRPGRVGELTGQWRGCCSTRESCLGRLHGHGAQCARVRLVGCTVGWLFASVRSMVLGSPVAGDSGLSKESYLFSYCWPTCSAFLLLCFFQLTWGKMEMLHFSLINCRFSDGQEHSLTWASRLLLYKRERGSGRHGLPLKKQRGKRWCS